jgi:hypothetical protein
MHPGERPDHFQVAEFLRPDVHQEVFAFRVVAVEPLHGILHGGGKFSVCAAELFKEHIAESRIGYTDADGVHQLFDMVVHARFGSA